MQKLILLLLLIGFQLQLLAQENTKTTSLKKYYAGIEPHVFPTGSYILGGVRFGENRRWSYETAFGTQLLHSGYWYNMNQFAVVLKHKKGRFQQFFLGEYLQYATKKNRWPNDIQFKEYYKKDLLLPAPIEAPLILGLLVGYRRDIYTAKSFRIQLQGSIVVGDFPFPLLPKPLLGIRLTTK